MQQYVSIVTKSSVQLSPSFSFSCIPFFVSLICPPYSEPSPIPSPHPIYAVSIAQTLLQNSNIQGVTGGTDQTSGECSLC